MNMDEYIQLKEKIIECYTRDLEALKIVYPEEWKMDHDRKAQREASK